MGSCQTGFFSVAANHQHRHSGRLLAGIQPHGHLAVAHSSFNAPRLSHFIQIAIFVFHYYEMLCRAAGRLSAAGRSFEGMVQSRVTPVSSFPHASGGNPARRNPWIPARSMRE
jgi:hypothetical protein